MADYRDQEWREAWERPKFPFSDNASLQNAAGDVLFSETFLDASFYVIGSASRLYISKISISNDLATLILGDETKSGIASGSFDIIAPPDEIRFFDSFDRPAGLIVSEALRLSIFQSWSIGDHEFTVNETEFVAFCCIPTPEIGVRGFLLDDGSIVTGDVWFIGEAGVILSLTEPLITLSDCGSGDQTIPAIRIDVVGDPLYLRKNCASSFSTPKFLESITFAKGDKKLRCGPGNFGDIKLLAHGLNNEHTVLRVQPTANGIKIEAVGETVQK